MSLAHFPREGAQFVLAPEVKVSWVLWSWQRVSWNWVTPRRVSVEPLVAPPKKTNHFGIFLDPGEVESISHGAHVEAPQVLPKQMLEATWEATGREIASGGN